MRPGYVCIGQSLCRQPSPIYRLDRIMTGNRNLREILENDQ